MYMYNEVANSFKHWSYIILIDIAGSATLPINKEL